MSKRRLLMLGVPLILITTMLAACGGSDDSKSDTDGTPGGGLDSPASTTDAIAAAPTSTASAGSGLRLLNLTGLDITEDDYRAVLGRALMSPNVEMALNCRLITEADGVARLTSSELAGYGFNGRGLTVATRQDGQVADPKDSERAIAIYIEECKRSGNRD